MEGELHSPKRRERGGREGGGVDGRASAAGGCLASPRSHERRTPRGFCPLSALVSVHTVICVSLVGGL